MALAHGTAQWRLIDYLGVKVSKIIYFQVDDSKTIANVVADLTAFAAVLNGVTDAASAGIASLDINFAPTGLKGTPVAGNAIALGVLSTFSQVGVPNVFSDQVPAVAQAQISNGHVIETPGSPYALYKAEFLAPLTNIQLESNQERLLSAFRNNDINTRKHRKQQRVTTSET